MNTKVASRKWFVTVFPDTHPWMFPERLPDGVRYMKGQLEMCPSTDRKHFHVYVYLRDKQRYTWVQKNVFNGHKVNCQVPRNDVASDRYVEKEDTRIAGPWSVGVPPDRRCNVHKFFDDEVTTPVSHDVQELLLTAEIIRSLEYRGLGSDWTMVDPEVTQRIMDKLMMGIIVDV